MRRKVCYIVSLVQKSLAFEWISVRLKDKYDLSFILLNPETSSLQQFLEKNGITVHLVPYRGKTDLVSAVIKTTSVLRAIKPDIVHCHLLDAQLIGLSSAFLARVKRRIYTRHNSNFHHVYHPGGVRYDNWSNRMATQIVSISQATDHTLQTLENVSPQKIRKIPHGFDFKELTDVSELRIQQVREKWKIPGDRIVIGVIARQIEWKGIQYVIPAFEKLLKKYPDAVLVLANAKGPYHDELNQMISPVAASVISIPFEEDVAALYKTFTVYAHTPIDPVCEAFGQTYVEAIACRVPSVFTLSGIAKEFISDRRNALVADFQNSDSVFDRLSELLASKDLQQHVKETGMEDVISRFGIEKMTFALKMLYDE